MIKKKSSYVSVKSSVEREYMDTLGKEMMKTVYGTHQCGSWFTNARGMVTALYPKSAISYWNRTRKLDLAQFDIQ